MKNIDKFDIYSGKILALLLENFPIATEIEIMRDVIKDENAPQKEQEFVYHTLKALQEYGFISYQDYTIGGELFTGVRLTLKALEVLKATPKSLGGKTIGDKIIDSVKLAKDESIKSGVGLAFSQGYTLISEAFKGAL